VTSVRLDPETESLIKLLAEETGRTKSRVIRDAIWALTRHDTRATKTRSPYEAFAHVIGCATGGPPDLSERTGEKFSLSLSGRTR